METIDCYLNSVPANWFYKNIFSHLDQLVCQNCLYSNKQFSLSNPLTRVSSSILSKVPR